MLDRNIQAQSVPSLCLPRRRILNTRLRHSTIIMADQPVRTLQTPAHRPISTLLPVPQHTAHRDSQATARMCRMGRHRHNTRRTSILRMGLDIHSSIRQASILQAHRRRHMPRDKLRSRLPGSARRSLASIAESAR
jgi:hypothetical protein